jgi:hypothetical protein
MGKPYGRDAAGRRLDLIGKPFEYRLAPIPGSRSGVRILGQEEHTAMAKAKSDGVYELNGGRFKIRQGDELPQGAEFQSAENVFHGVNAEFNADEVETVNKAEPVNFQQRADGPAPENRAVGSKKADK